MRFAECQFRDDPTCKDVQEIVTQRGAGKGHSKKKAQEQDPKNKAQVQDAGTDTPATKSKTGTTAALASGSLPPGNLCSIPHKLTLHFEDISPPGLQLDAEVNSEAGADGDEQLAVWNVKVEPKVKILRSRLSIKRILRIGLLPE